MEISGSNTVSIIDIYRRYSDIKMGSSYPSRDGTVTIHDESEKDKLSREATYQLSKMVDTSVKSRGSILDELHKLVSCQNIMEDFREFSRFYDFVFFMCRENGQKNISVSRAVAAWKLVLAGRFRLLNQWCDFVEKNQRYNISEDTWRQVLAFSRCVHENLEGYDPEGAWPTLIDDFVEHMYRITGSNNCSSYNSTCNCCDPETETETSASEDHLPGLKNLPGLKRKLNDNFQRLGLEHNSIHPDVINSIISFKRRKQQFQNLGGHVENQPEDVLGEESQAYKVGSSLNTPKCPCAVEDCLTKGFAGLFSCAQNQDRRLSCSVTRRI